MAAGGTAPASTTASRRARASAASGFATHPLELLLAGRITEHNVVSGRRRDRHRLASRQSRAKYACAYPRSLQSCCGGSVMPSLCQLRPWSAGSCDRLGARTRSIDRAFADVSDTCRSGAMRSSNLGLVSSPQRARNAGNLSITYKQVQQRMGPIISRAAAPCWGSNFSRPAGRRRCENNHGGW
jgi:hypothetical protein